MHGERGILRYWAQTNGKAVIALPSRMLLNLLKKPLKTAFVPNLPVAN